MISLVIHIPVHMIRTVSRFLRDLWWPDIFLRHFLLFLSFNLSPVCVQMMVAGAKKHTHRQYCSCSSLQLLFRPAGRCSLSTVSWLRARVSIQSVVLGIPPTRRVASFNASNDLIMLNKTTTGDHYSPA